MFKNPILLHLSFVGAYFISTVRAQSDGGFWAGLWSDNIAVGAGATAGISVAALIIGFVAGRMCRRRRDARAAKAGLQTDMTGKTAMSTTMSSINSSFIGTDVTNNRTTNQTATNQAPTTMSSDSAVRGDAQL